MAFSTFQVGCRLHQILAMTVPSKTSGIHFTGGGGLKWVSLSEKKSFSTIQTRGLEWQQQLILRLFLMRVLNCIILFKN
jgi:hypothetical protein